MNINDERKNKITTIMNLLGSYFSRDMIIKKFGARIADQISILVQAELGIKMLIFSDYSISVNDLSMKLMDKIINLLLVEKSE